MTNLNQRKAVATAAGWTALQFKAHCGLKGIAPDSEKRPVPDYLNDLTAMQGALDCLDDEQWTTFMLYLRDVAAPGSDLGKWMTVRRCLEATAAQQVEAFLRTLNLWNDHEPDL